MIKKLITEGSYDDFLMTYGKELRDAVSMLRQMNNAGVLDDDWNDKLINKIEKAMSTYDKNVGEAIEDFILNKRVEPRDIANIAFNNYNRWGTEPQHVIFAIEDFYNVLKSERLVK